MVTRGRRRQTNNPSQLVVIFPHLVAFSSNCSYFFLHSKVSFTCLLSHIAHNPHSVHSSLRVAHRRQEFPCPQSMDNPYGASGPPGYSSNPPGYDPDENSLPSHSASAGSQMRLLGSMDDPVYTAYGSTPFLSGYLLTSPARVLPIVLTTQTTHIVSLLRQTARHPLPFPEILLSRTILRSRLLRDTTPPLGEGQLRLTMMSLLFPRPPRGEGVAAM